MRYFYIYRSKNSAVYILNINDLNGSLEFYKTLTLSHKIKKSLFKYYLYSLFLFKKSNFLSKEEVKVFLNRNNIDSCNLTFNKKVSFLISPTKDKVIIRFSRDLFKKIAFGNSLDKVVTESKIYAILNRKNLNFFNTSSISNIKKDRNCISFSLQNRNFNSSNRDIVKASVEFFLVNSSKTLFKKYIDNLVDRSIKIIDLKYLHKINLKLMQYKNMEISLGLTHNDFKPWNIDISKGIQIYDFEECSFNGLALIDLINYYVDPILHKSNRRIYSTLNSKKIRKDLCRYLNLVEIEGIPIDIFIYCYLVERVLFWNKNSNLKKINRYIELLDYYLEHQYEENSFCPSIK